MTATPRPPEREALLETYVDVQRLLQQLAELYRCEQESETFATAAGILSTHFPVLHYRALVGVRPEPTADVHFLVTREPDGPLGALPAVDQAEVDYALGRRRPALIPFGDAEPVGALVKSPEALRGRLLIPIETRRGAPAVLVLYVGLDDSTERYALEVAAHVGAAMSSTLDKVRLLAATRAQSDLLDNVLESVPLGLVAVDMEDRITTFNRNAELLLGIQRFYVLRARYEQVLPGRLPEVFRSMQLMTLREQGTVKHELDLVDEDGEELSLGLTTSIIYGRDKAPQGVLFVLRDLALTREVEKLRKLDQMKDEFVHTVSHELKTPLTAILGGTEILMLDPSKLDPEQSELLGIVDDGARRLRTLINDLLDLSRLEGGGVDLAESEAQLSELVDATCDLLRRQGRAGNCAIERDYAEGLMPLVLDRDKIRQVLENLVSNAIKYSPAGGTITVRIARYDDPELGEMQRVDVTDQGIGVGPDDLERIFDKFFRVNASITAEVEGTGLGLSITRHIVEMHGGRIWVESELGEGSTFSFALPVKLPGNRGVTPNGD